MREGKRAGGTTEGGRGERAGEKEREREGGKGREGEVGGREVRGESYNTRCLSLAIFC